jgi:hypothetical protein
MENQTLLVEEQKRDLWIMNFGHQNVVWYYRRVTPVP